MKLIFIFLFSFWQPTGYPKDNLKNILELAHSNHQLFKRNQIETQRAKDEVSLLKTGFMPEISIQANLDYGNKTLTSKSGFNRWDSELKARLEQSIYNGGKEYTYFRLKKIVPNLVEYNNLIKKLDHFSKINISYFQYKKSSTNLSNLKKQIMVLEKALKEVKRRSQIGRVSKADYFSGQSQLQRLKANLLSIEEEVLFYQSELNQLLGIDFIEDKDTIISWQEYSEVPLQWKNKLQSVPQLKLLKTEIQSAQEQVNIIKSEYRPKISLQSNAYLNKRTNGVDDYDISLNLTWSLFSFGETSHKVEIEKAKLYLAKAKKTEAQRNIDTFYDMHIKRHSKKLTHIDRLQKAVDLGQKSYLFQTSEYKKGLLSYIELSRTLDDLIEIERQLTNAINDLAMNWYSIKFFLGDTLI